MRASDVSMSDVHTANSRSSTDLNVNTPNQAVGVGVGVGVDKAIITQQEN